jgi:hypothetical protein
MELFRIILEFIFYDFENNLTYFDRQFHIHVIHRRVGLA